MRSISIAAALLTALSAGSLAAQAPDSASDHSRHSPAGDQALIANALSAAPLGIANGATVIAHDGRVLRPGKTDWVCMPDIPDVPNNTPMCLDAEWRGFIDSWMNKRTPKVTRVAFGYMLQGDLPVSNVDPFAKAPAATNQWIEKGAPHVMMLVPDVKLLDEISTDPTNGGPFVMWKGTAYAHIMIPATAAPTKHP